MGPTTRALLVVVLLLTAPGVGAQSPSDPTGHWEGTIHAPNMEVAIAIDLTRNAKGELSGTFAQASQGIKGLPLATVTAEGAAVQMVLKAGSGGGTFKGTLSADGKTLKGDFITAEGGYAIPFDAARTGDAVVASAPKSAAIRKDLEGTWDGALDVQGKVMRVQLVMGNEGDGATGTIQSIDGSGVKIPVAMAVSGTTLTVTADQVGASFVGAISGDASALTGTWTQGGGSLPLVLRRTK